MEAVARGCCTSCDEPLVYLIWRNGRRTIVVECGCGDTNTFDLELLTQALGSQDIYEVMLESFQPRGLPS